MAMWHNIAHPSLKTCEAKAGVTVLHIMGDLSIPISPSYWPYIYIVVRPEIYSYGKVECAKSIFILSKSLKFETFSLGACVKFIIHLKFNFVSSPYVFIINEIRNILSNAIFLMLDLDFAVFQKKKHDTN